MPVSGCGRHDSGDAAGEENSEATECYHHGYRGSMLRKRPRLFIVSLAAGLALPASARTWNAKTDWGATGDGKTNDYPTIQRGITAMADGDTVVFPAPGIYYLASTVRFSAGGIRVKCQPGAVLVGPNNGTDIFANLQSNTAIGGSATRDASSMAAAFRPMERGRRRTDAGSGSHQPDLYLQHLREYDLRAEQLSHQRRHLHRRRVEQRSHPP